jgi:hypothetical protein
VVTKALRGAVEEFQIVEELGDEFGEEGIGEQVVRWSASREPVNA